jgi:hypothetical protein
VKPGKTFVVDQDRDPLQDSTGYRVNSGKREGQVLCIDDFITWITAERGLVDFVRPYKIEMEQPDVWRFVTLQIWALCTTGGRRYWEPLQDTIQQMWERQVAA